MTTWFESNWEIEARNYDLSYKAGVYDFDVHIEVEMTKFGIISFQKVMRYNGDWDVIFKKRERVYLLQYYLILRNDHDYRFIFE